MKELITEHEIFEISRTVKPTEDVFRLIANKVNERHQQTMKERAIEFARQQLGQATRCPRS